MSNNILKKPARLMTVIISVLCVICGLVAVNAFAATISPSKNCMVEIYQLAPESTSLMESYVIKTPNGKLVVIDGGIDGAGDEIGVTATPYITAALRSIAGVGEGEHFTVDAWFVSHGHIDHYLELAKILCAYTDDASYTGETVTLADSTKKTWKATPDTNFTIKNFYFDFPDDGEWGRATEITGTPYFAKFKEGLDKYAKANNITVNNSYYDDLNGKVVNENAIEKGLTITIDGVDFEILQTWSTGDGQVNSNSMVIRVVNEGQSALFLNDATVESGDRLLASKGAGAVKSNVVQLGHHGQNGCSEEFYEAIDAQNSVRLWAIPMNVWKGEASSYQTKQVRSWFGLAENYLEYVETRMDFVAALYDAYPVDKTSVTAWDNVIDTMKVTLPTEPVYRTANQFDLIEGATIRVGTPDKINGLRFSAIMKTVDTEAEYGFVIVPREYMETVTGAFGFDGDYISALVSKYGEDGIIKMGSMPIDKGNHFQINGSVGNIKFKNSTLEFTPIAYMYKNGEYTYASYDTIDDISISIFKLATKAYTENPNGEYADVYKGFVDNAINLINGNPQGTEITSYNLTFDQTSLTLYPDDVAELKFTTDFDLENVTLKYDPEIVSYNVETGEVRFVKCGTTQIQASCMGMTSSVDVTCTVEIEDGYLASFDRDAYADLVRKNEFPGRSAASVTAERVDSYEDKNGVTETNVMKITTVSEGGSARVGDFVIDLPKAVSATGSKKATIRILFQDSDATWLAFRNVKDGAEYYPSEEVKIAPNTGLSEAQKNVWMDITIDYSATDTEYMDRIAMLIQGGAAGGTHTIYVAYVIESDAVESILANALPEGYLADFSSNLYGGTVGSNPLRINPVTSLMADSYTDANGVTETKIVKITTTARASGTSIADFAIDLPKAVSTSGSKKVSVRMLIKKSDATFIGFRNRDASGVEYYSAPLITQGEALAGSKKNVWMDVVVDYSKTGADYMDRMSLLVQGGANSATHEFYIAYVVEADTTKATVVATLPNGYLADFSSPLYGALVTDGNKDNTLVTSWLPSFEGETGVLKVTVGNLSSRGLDFLFDLPKAHTGKYTLKIWVSEDSDCPLIGVSNSGAAFLGDKALFTAKGSWQTVTIDGSGDGYNNEKICILGYDGTNKATKLEVYLAWVYDGTPTAD